MNATIIAALISGAVTLIVCLINSFLQWKSSNKKYNETITMIDYKLSELTKRVDKHNNIIERTYKLEEKTTLQDEQIKVANHRISDLENRKGH